MVIVGTIVALSQRKADARSRDRAIELEEAT
jgi:hypothetical protein